MTLLPGWHPVVVHFPLALVLTSAAALCLARVLRQQGLAATLATVGTWNLCLGTLGALLELGTGLAAVIDLHPGPAARQAVSLHLKWAVVTSLGLLILAVWRGAGKPQDSRPSRLFLVLLCAACAALIMTGYRGGQNVYRYGIGVMNDSSSRPGI